MAEKKYYSTSEAISRLATVGIAGSTFFRWVREGIIEKELPKGRVRGAFYPREQIEQLISQRQGVAPIEEEDEIKGITDWIQQNDVPYVLALEYETYGPEIAVDISISRTWWEKNPYMCRILYNQTNRKDVWGVLTVLPMKEETILKICRHEMDEKEISPNDILTYDMAGEYAVYVSTAIIRKERRNEIIKLTNTVLGFFCEQYPRVHLEKMYAVAATDEGYQMIKHLYFSPRYDLSDDSFELRPMRPNPSPIIKAYQECIKEKSE